MDKVHSNYCQLAAVVRGEKKDIICNMLCTYNVIKAVKTPEAGYELASFSISV